MDIRKINFSTARDLIISCCKYKTKDLLDQRLVPIVPPGLHSAQIRHDSALRELVQFEQLAQDHDPSVKKTNSFSLHTIKNRRQFRNSAVDFADLKNNLIPIYIYIYIYIYMKHQDSF
jgi:hypothetical protein